MVEIVRRGVLPRQVKYRAECRDCGCQFKFRREEAASVHEAGRGDFLRIGCPCCGVAVTRDLARLAWERGEDG